MEHLTIDVDDDKDFSQRNNQEWEASSVQVHNGEEVEPSLRKEGRHCHHYFTWKYC